MKHLKTYATIFENTGRYVPLRSDDDINTYLKNINDFLLEFKDSDIPVYTKRIFGCSETIGLAVSLNTSSSNTEFDITSDLIDALKSMDSYLESERVEVTRIAVKRFEISKNEKPPLTNVLSNNYTTEFNNMSDFLKYLEKNINPVIHHRYRCEYYVKYTWIYLNYEFNRL